MEEHLDPDPPADAAQPANHITVGARVACPTCDGRGYRIRQGGTADGDKTKVPVVCGDCDGSGDQAVVA